MASTVYIIGNGFDLHHGIPSEYSDFKEYLERTCPALYEKIKKYYPELGPNWCNFEKSLGEADYASINNDSSLYIYRDLSSGLRTKFVNWVRSLENKLGNKLLSFEDDSSFLTFNYTHTLQNTYEVNKSRITHIHKDWKCADLIFGHNNTVEPDYNPGQDLAECGDQRMHFNSLRKNPDNQRPAILKNINAGEVDRNLPCNRLSSASKIIILGHSLNEIDKPYFNWIFDELDSPDTKWQYSYFGSTEEKKEQDKQKKLAFLLNIGIPATQIEPITMDMLELK